MKLSARNLKGTAAKMTQGAINGIFATECRGTKIKSGITNETVEILTSKSATRPV